MPKISTGSTAIGFASSIRIGFRALGSSGPFSYLPLKRADELPLSFDVPTSGSWEVEYTEICPNCSGGIYSDAILVVVTV